MVAARCEASGQARSCRHAIEISSSLPCLKMPASPSNLPQKSLLRRLHLQHYLAPCRHDGPAPGRRRTGTYRRSPLRMHQDRLAATSFLAQPPGLLGNCAEVPRSSSLHPRTSYSSSLPETCHRSCASCAVHLASRNWAGYRARQIGASPRSVWPQPSQLRSRDCVASTNSDRFQRLGVAVGEGFVMASEHCRASR